MNDKRVIVNGLKIYPFASENELFDFINNEKKILIAVNSKKIKGANDEIRTIVNNNIGYVDGVGAQIALKHKGIKNAIKIPGCELWLKIIKHYENSKSFYFIGGKQNIIDSTIKKLKQEYPNINILGYRNGYIKNQQEKANLINDIRQKKPDIIFVAMGSPKQEYLMQELYREHTAVYQGLGGSFDVYVGSVRRAPKWISNHNLEGPYRAFWEPRKRLKGVLTDFLFLIRLKLGQY